MATTYVFSLPYHGHINPCIAVIAELVRRGERVVFYTEPDFRAIVEGTGALFRHLAFEEPNRGRSLLEMVTRQLELTERCMPDLVRAGTDEGVAYVLVDYACLWGRVFARTLGVPLVVMHSTFPDAFAQRPPVRVLCREILRTPSLVRVLAHFKSLDRRIARTWRVRQLGLPMHLLQGRCGDSHIVLTSAEMQPGGAPPGDYHFVGQCVRTCGATLGEPLPPPVDRRPLIYVSLGTFWNGRPDFFRLCIDAYRNADFEVLLSTGKSVDAACLGELPAHIHVRTHVDQIEVLKRTAVFISHGGMNSVCEAMLAGTPLLMFPLANDQFALARHVEALGAGLILPGAGLTATELLAMTHRVLADAALQSRCRELSEKLNAVDGARRAADLIVPMGRVPMRASAAIGL